VRAECLVLFGATGDLAKKKLFPALYHMQLNKELDIPVVGVASTRWTQEQFKQNAVDAIRKAIKDVDEEVLNTLISSMRLVIGDYREPSTFDELRAAVGESTLTAYYLAIAPDQFTAVSMGLANAGLASTARLVVEKPFGRDLASAVALNEALEQVVKEDQIYRIDHYLGKESVEDLLVFRFANTLFEPVWNRNYISNIQITMFESFGVEGRGRFYDGVGAIRDVLQNHLLQVLAMLTMEPPIDLSGEAIQNEKVKLLSAIREVEPGEIVRGQYAGYLDEPGVDPNSNVETFTAIRLHIDNWRWAGVPIFMRTGKRMAETSLEAVVEFKQPPRMLFKPVEGHLPSPNVLRFRLGIGDGVDMQLQVKAPGADLFTSQVDLSVEFSAAFGQRQEAYERLLDAAIEGDHFRFTRIDAVLESWRILDSALHNLSPIETYESGSHGPSCADDLIAEFGGWNPLHNSAI
jgi:glucose-6-phosphate 1-dehydrogenase